jgi:type I restriction-modification system DNA methylase subunit
MPHQKAPEKLTEVFISENFGISSPTYTNFRDCVISWWNTEKYCKLLDTSLKKWCKQFQLNYRKPEDFQVLFINHSYLLILANLIINSYLKKIQENHPINKCLIEPVSADFSLDNLERFSFLEYLTFEELKSMKQEVSSNILAKLNTLTDWCLKEDIFQGLYEQLVNKSSRHEKGEYYTPDWLSQLIIQEIWDLWSKKKNRIKENPTILDPACGSGTFIFNYQYYYYHSLDSSKDDYLEIFGFDINPIAVYLAQINSIFSLPENIFIEAVSQKSYFYQNIVQKDALKENALLDYIEENQSDYKFDILVGNPPWIVLRSINDTDYQKELKKDFIRYNLVSGKEVHLFTQLDLATLFFMKCSKQYLEKGGITAFVMPKSVITGAIQHERFREFKYPQLKLQLIFDLQNVSPLFLIIQLR